MVGLPVEEEEEPTWPQKHALSQKWDSHQLIREQMRQHQKLLLWPSPALTGAANKSTLKLNRFAIQSILELWTEFSDTPKAPPIGWFRQEVHIAEN